MEKKYYTKTAVKDLGFSDSMIKKLLPEPIEKRNTLYRGGPNIKLYPIDIVNAVMKTPEYKELYEAYLRRREIGQEVSEKKKEQAINDAKELAEELWVETIPIDELRDLTIEQKNDYESMKGNYDYMAQTADDATIKRWMRNYLRHECSNYDYIWTTFRKKIGIREAYSVIRAKMDDLISKNYPELK